MEYEKENGRHMLLTDDVIKKWAEEWASKKAPDASRSYSISKPDLRAGFIEGAKNARDWYENLIRIYPPEKLIGKFKVEEKN